MAQHWQVRARGNVRAPFADVVSWWTADERANDLRRRLEGRLGAKVRVAWTQGKVGADTWLEARWTSPRRPGEARWRMVRRQPQTVEGRPERVHLVSSLITEGMRPRGNHEVTESQIETVFIDRDPTTELRFRHSWTVTGAGIWRQLVTRRAMASIVRADLAELMLRCEASVNGRDTGQARST